MIVFTLAINFVNGLNIFSTVEAGVPVGTNTSNTFGGFLTGGSISGMGAMWDIVLTTGGIIAVGVAILMRSAIPVGVYIYSGVFWTSYGHALKVVTGLGTSSGSLIPGDFLLIGTVIMLFFWCGSVAGMFSGSG